MRMRRVYREGMPEPTPPVFTARLTRPEADRPQFVDLTVTATASHTLHTFGMEPEQLADAASRIRGVLAARVVDAAPAPVRYIQHPPGAVEREPLVVVTRARLERILEYLHRGDLTTAGIMVAAELVEHVAPPLTIKGLS